MRIVIYLWLLFVSFFCVSGISRFAIPFRCFSIARAAANIDLTHFDVLNERITEDDRKKQTTTAAAKTRTYDSGTSAAQWEYSSGFYFNKI